MTDEEMVMLCAVRYALGRQTYIVDLVCNYIKSKCKTMGPLALTNMIKDIEAQESFGYGAKCDKQDWLDLLHILKVETESWKAFVGKV